MDYVEQAIAEAEAILGEGGREKLQRVKCSRCKDKVVGPTVAASSLVEVKNPLMPTNGTSLCGRCTLTLLEFLTPEIVGDPAWEVPKTHMLNQWGPR